jgi:hypothetical protein
MDWKPIVADLLKSRMTATVLGVLAGFLATKLGLPEEQLSTLLLSITGLVSAYVIQRGYSKPREISARNGGSAKPANPTP